jgi:hypothetical protein
VSYERLADLAAKAGNVDEARQLLVFAANTRRRLLHRESQRIDLAEELCVTLLQLAAVENDLAAVRLEVVKILTPFEQFGAITPKGVQLLQWCREQE